MTPDQYAKEITKGLWVYPRRKREIEQEIIEHLEDAGEEHNIGHWTEEEIIKHFGSKKQLRKQFTKGGLPVWAKLVRLGLWGLAGIVGIVFLFNLYVLCFYSIDPAMIRMYRANQAFFNKFQPQANYNAHEQIAWLDPNDENAVQTWELFEKCIEARDSFHAADGIAREEYKSRPEIAKKIQSVTPPFQMGQPGMMMGMGVPVEYQVLNEEELKKMDEYIHQETHDAALALMDLWMQIKPENHFHFKRPEVTEEDIRLYKQYAPHTDQLHLDSPHSAQRYPWLRVAVDNQFHQSHMSAEEIIQYSKDITFRQPYYMAILDMLGRIRDHSKELPDEQAKQVVQASSLWITKYIKAVNPDVDMLVDIIISVSYMGILRQMVTDHVDAFDDFPTHTNTLQAFVDVPVSSMVNDWPDFDEFEHYEHSIFNAIVMGMGQFSAFRAQFGLMQWFYSPNSDGYHHYELMKRGVYLVLMNMTMNNFNNMQERINNVLAWQESAKALLALEEHLQAGKPMDSFSPLQAGITDPFQDEGLQFEVSDEAITLSSAGSNDVFDPGIVYDASNGIRSKGDLIWTLKRN